MYYDYDRLNLHVKITLMYNDKSMGPGIANILQLVKETGKLSEACKLMGISPSKVWKVIKRAEEDLNFKLIHTITGGTGGGRSELTEEGEDFLQRYQSFSNEADEIIKTLFEKYFKYDKI